MVTRSLVDAPDPQSEVVRADKTQARQACSWPEVLVATSTIGGGVPDCRPRAPGTARESRHSIRRRRHGHRRARCDDRRVRAHCRRRMGQPARDPRPRDPARDRLGLSAPRSCATKRLTRCSWTRRISSSRALLPPMGGVRRCSSSAPRRACSDSCPLIKAVFNLGQVMLSVVVRTGDISCLSTSGPPGTSRYRAVLGAIAARFAMTVIGAVLVGLVVSTVRGLSFRRTSETGSGRESCNG